MSHRHFLTAAGVLAILIVVAFLATEIELGIRFSRPCRLLPQTEWLLLKPQSDTFETRLLDRRAGNRKQIELFQFERGDQVRFSIAPEIVPGETLPAGSEVARLDSHRNRQLLAELGPQLEGAEAELRAALTGAKTELIAQARGQMEAARALNDQMAAEFRWTLSLWEQGLASEAVRERVAAQQRKAQADLAAAQSWLEAAEAGEKDAIIAAGQARIDLFKSQITEARRRVAAERICCPIGGEVVTLEADTALVRIAGLDTLYAVAPVPTSRAMRLGPGMEAVVHPIGTSGGGLPGTVARVDRHATAQNGLTFFWVTVAVPNPGHTTPAGIRGTVHFVGERVTLLAWLSDRIRHAADRSLGA